MKEDLFFKLKIATVLSIVIGYGIYIIVKISKMNNIKERISMVKSKCPDYWEVIDQTRCKNVKKIGTCNNTDDNLIMNFNDKIFNSNDGNYQKCLWSKNCGVSWQGIDLKC